MKAGWEGVRSALSQPNYRVFTVGNVFSLVGTWVQRVALAWLIWQVTRSGAWLGAIAFADLFPMVMVTPFAGALADRSDRLRVTRASQALLMLQAGLLATFSALGLLSAEAIFVLALAGGVITAFNQPFRMALLPSLVDRSHLTSAVAINSIVFNTARFLGPAVAGLIITWGSVTAAFVANFLTFAIFLLALARIRLVSGGRPVGPSGGLIRAIAEGYRYAAGHVGLGAMLLTLVMISLCIRPILELMPGYAALFGSEVTGFAVMTSVFGLGSLIGAVWVSLRNDARALARMALSSGLVMSTTLLVAASTKHEWVALAALFVLGFGMVVSGIANQTVIQLAVRDHLRGRILALHSVIFRGAPALGALVMGSASDLVSLRWPLAIGALVAFGFTWFIWSRRKRIIRDLDLQI